MKFQVQMLAFQPEFCRRTVDVPDSELATASLASPLAKLSLIFKYGQNEFQNVPGICSVSCGDVIEIPIDGGNIELYLVKACGFHKLTGAEYEDYERTDRRDRSFYPLIHQHDDPKIVGYWVMSPQVGEIISTDRMIHHRHGLRAGIHQLVKWGLNGNTVFPYRRIEDAVDQLKFLTEPTEAAGESFYLVRVFDNGQMKMEEYSA